MRRRARRSLPSGPDDGRVYELPLAKGRSVVLEPYRIYVKSKGKQRDSVLVRWALLLGALQLRASFVGRKQEAAYLWQDLKFGKGRAEVRWAQVVGLGLAVVALFVFPCALGDTDEVLAYSLPAAAAAYLGARLVLRRRALVIRGGFSRIALPWTPEERGFGEFTKALERRVLYWRDAPIEERGAVETTCRVDWEQTRPEEGVLVLRSVYQADNLPPVCVATGEAAEVLFPSTQAVGLDLGWFSLSAVFRLNLPMTRRSAESARFHQRLYRAASFLGPVVFSALYWLVRMAPGIETWSFRSWPNVALLAVFSFAWMRVWSRWRRVLPVHVVRGGRGGGKQHLALRFSSSRALEEVLKACPRPEAPSG
jgi:hypothetical protein